MKLNKDELFARYPAANRQAARQALLTELRDFDRPVIVLDDDPTGTQTVHDIPVYTDWSETSLRDALAGESRLFYILTNSRGFSAAKTREVHAEIMRRALKLCGEREPVLLSRSDSTLRGHYPLETQTLRETFEQETGRKVDGEVILPFFAEGGRFTAGDTHYVAYGSELIPAGETEFARDKSFGYSASDLRAWVEEKTGGAYPAEGVVSISIEELRAGDVDAVARKLKDIADFNKVVVNALETADVEVFAAAVLRAMKAGKRFIFRSAAALPKALGGIGDRPLLTGAEMRRGTDGRGGLVIAGSHVAKTTAQLEELKKLDDVDFITFNPLWGIIPGGMEEARRRAVGAAEASIAAGRTAVIQTPRTRFELGGTPDEELRLAVAISDQLTTLIRDFSLMPAFLIAKGGITSSDVATKGLGVRKARVMGQILPGVPVWECGAESLIPGLPYVIFPGNVGGETALREAVEKLR